jgi:hypothetical protein
MSVRNRLRWLVVFGLLLAVVGRAHADSADPKYTVTDPKTQDEDFALQGEYWGTIYCDPACRATRFIGLQVVALGSGQFEGRLFPGGLPGNGWTGEAPQTVKGSRSGSGAALEAGPYAINISDLGQNASVHPAQSTAAATLGTLTKVARTSLTMGAGVPAGGALLFGNGSQKAWDGSGQFVDLAKLCWQDPKVTDDGLLSAGAKTRNLYQDFRLHVEFRVPFMPNARGQARGNSGVYLNSRQEVQILDSFGLEGVNNEAGSLYKFKKPDINMAFPPLAWQTYDISYRGARFDAEGKKTESVRISVVHNGVVVQNNVEVPGPTGGGAKESTMLLPLNLQDHGNPVVFRNVWIAPLESNTCCGRRRR